MYLVHCAPVKYPRPSPGDFLPTSFPNPDPSDGVDPVSKPRERIRDSRFVFVSSKGLTPYIPPVTEYEWVERYDVLRQNQAETPRYQIVYQKDAGRNPEGLELHGRLGHSWYAYGWYRGSLFLLQALFRKGILKPFKVARHGVRN